MNPHPRDIKSNIWRAILSATDTEIVEGMSFYYGANGLCRFVARLFNSTIESTAGVYAALSPLNGWESNVANMIDVFRYGEEANTNTPKINKRKAILISKGEDPLSVLKGRKVTAFYKGILNPEDKSPIPVDRHLINLALGEKITSNQELRSFASNAKLYGKIESCYIELGERENIGNRLASIAWFVQRRIQSGQSIMLQPSRLVCCNKPLESMGSKKYRCSLCKKVTSKLIVRNLLHSRARTIPLFYVDGYPVNEDPRSRRQIYLGIGHEFANKRGWQYLSRYKVMKKLNRKLLTDEHVHHKDLDKQHDRESNYELLLAESHGRYHSYIATLAGYRDELGRFVEHEQPISI